MFESQGCTGCHTLAAAGSTGTTGPDLDGALKGKSTAFIKESIVDPNAEIAEGLSAERDAADLRRPAARRSSTRSSRTSSSRRAATVAPLDARLTRPSCGRVGRPLGEVTHEASYASLASAVLLAIALRCGDRPEPRPRRPSPAATAGSCSSTSPSSSPSQITTVTPRGRHARVLTDYKREAVQPDVSPRGGRIAFTLIGSRRVPDKVITMRIGGANAHSDHPRVHRPVPRRRRARLVAGRAPDRLQPRLRADRRRQRRPHRPHDHEPQRDAYARRCCTRRHTAAASADSRPAAGPGRRTGPSSRARSWTSTARARRRRSSPSTSPRSTSHRITPWRLNAGNPDYSPDGRRIVFNSAWEGQTHSSLYTINPDGTEPAPPQPPAASATRSRPSSAPRATRSSTPSPGGARPSTSRAGRSAARCASGSRATPCAASTRSGPRVPRHRRYSPWWGHSGVSPRLNAAAPIACESRRQNIDSAASTSLRSRSS